ncbi:hypothetical protein HEQ60_03315 [Haematospirillum sp. H1815]|uniref:SspB family protein n=1 Tax=Haematospirillum sp. H1815 TaxID=2723108 RepID=UPI00143B1636|nr:ClpXP protease specificity-enhancing factor SspB [Haematospirillum sp. H1815]NKD76798.1 hypothetical protein [Haematospirillum sp. H1815]
MSEIHISYEDLVEQALRTVLRDVLRGARDQGLPGGHHFYITFQTDADGVVMSSRLRARYPEEMTIVLQHQFWNLTVDDVMFSVDLSFSGQTEHLRVPFAAVTAFADPYARFGLQFRGGLDVDVDMEDDGSEDDDGYDDPEYGDGKPVARNTDEAPSDDSTGPSDGSNVVALDAFRRK